MQTEYYSYVFFACVGRTTRQRMFVDKGHYERDLRWGIVWIFNQKFSKTEMFDEKYNKFWKCIETSYKCDDCQNIVIYVQSTK